MWPTISYISRSSVTFQHGDREAKISGEMLLPAPGQPGFVLYRSSIRGWEPPYDEEPLDDATKAWILSQAIRILNQRGILVEVEQ